MSACLGKQRHASQAAAEKAAVGLRKRDIKRGQEPSARTYACEFCRGWHLTSWKAEKQSEWVPYRCFSCPALFADHMDLASHRGSHAHPDEPFWEWFHRRNT